MQTSSKASVLSWFLLALGCTGFEARNYNGPAPARTSGGAAGYSYDAGRAGGGASAVLPPPRGSEGDWEPPPEDSGGAQGDDEGGNDHSAPVDSRHDRGAGGTLSGEGGAASTPNGGGEAGEAGGGRAGRGSGAGSGSGSGGAAAGGRGAAGTSGHGASGTSGRAGAGGHGGQGASTAGRDGAGAGGSSTGSAGTTSLGGASGTTTAGGAGGTTTGGVVFSEYVEGSKRYKALELRALTPSVLDGCRIATYFNGETTAKASSVVALTGALAAGATSVVCSPDLAELLGAVCTFSANLSFNGNDAIALECGAATLDVIGQIGVDPGAAWTGGDATTVDQTLRRRCSVTQGDATGTDAFDPSLEWRALTSDDFSGLGLPDCG
jgi:hypothetical protein